MIKEALSKSDGFIKDGRIRLDGHEDRDQNSPLRVAADATGRWTLHIRPGVLTPGNHSLTVYVTDPSGRSSTPTVPRFFTILASFIRPVVLPGLPTPPVISLPKDNVVAATNQVTVVGVSQAFAQIEVWRNNRLVGSVFADKHGGWYLTVTLQTGVNEITSRACHGKVCSDFSKVTHVVYNPGEAPPVPLRLLLDSYRFTTAVSKNISLAVSAFSGQTPYEFEIDWGDGNDQLVKEAGSQTTFSHAYAKGGNYSGKVVAHDGSGLSAETAFSVAVQVTGGGRRNWAAILAVVAVATAAAVAVAGAVAAQAGATSFIGTHVRTGVRHIRRLLRRFK